MTTTGRPEDVAETARWEQGKATQPDAVTFSLDWDGYHLSGTLPGDVAHRVIAAAMAPTSVIHIGASRLSEADVDKVRDGLTRRLRRGGAM